MKPYHLLTLILFFLIYDKVEAQKYKIEKEPIWVKNIDLPKRSSFSKYEISSGYYLTLADYQFNLNENTVFTHEVINVVSYGGITKASQISITYDTSYQKIKIHHLYIHRNGELIDRTKDLSFEKINNEFALNNGIYFGQITAYDNLDDIRKDDYIDFSYSLIGKNPIFGKEKYLFIPLESTNQIDLLHVGILYSKTNDYRYKLINCDSSVVFSESNNGTNQQLEINVNNIKAINLEDNIPTYETPYKHFILSSFKNWNDVNTWAQSIFVLKNEPNLESVFKEIFTGNETTEDKINKIIDFVQDDIRYMGIEAGIGSIKPFSPEQVVKQRFGDCKDKSLLLVTLLKKIGIKEAFPALINTNMKQKTDQFFPTNEIFDHCIVTFKYNQKTFWVDPTFTQQGGDFRSMSISNYHKALIVGVNSDSLSKMEPQEFASGLNMADELRVTSFSAPATLILNSNRIGFEADQRRILLEQYSSTDLSNWVTEELRKFYPTVNKTEDIKISDDVKQNSLNTIYKYEVDGFWQDGDKLNDQNFAGYMIFKYEPTTLYDYLSVSTCQPRKYDFQLNYPLNIQYKITFKLPKELIMLDNYINYDNAAFFFDKKTEQLSSTSFQITYNFKIKDEIIKASDFIKACEEKNTIAKSLPILIYLKK